MRNENYKYYTWPTLQAIGTVLLSFHYLEIPDEMTLSLIEAIALMVGIPLIVLLLRLAWIIISSYIINLSKLLIYKLSKQQIVSICLFPFFYSRGKWKLANVFWVYDDRTCFAMNRYLKDKSSFETLCSYILKRNRILATIYCLVSLGIMFLCAYINLALAWLIGIGALEHFLYQAEYKKLTSANAMAFAGLRKVDTRLMLHMLSNQSKIEILDIGEEVAKILSIEMLDPDGGYFFNYLCLSSIFNEICDGSSNSLSFYMREKVELIKCNSDVALQSVKYTDKDPFFKYIDKDVCLFYNNYREFLLYVLMYFELIEDTSGFKTLNNYIKYMLEKVEKYYIKDNKLSNAILTKKFDEYRDLYHNVLSFKVIEEKTIFTGYETLPIWRKQRAQFIKLYNSKKDRE